MVANAQRQIGRARLAQVTRVNTNPDPERLEPDNLEFALKLLRAVRWDNADLKRDNERLQAQITRLKNMISSEHRAMLEGEACLAPAPMQLDGRPVLTQAEAAERAGVSVSTASRYCTTGHWQARQSGTHWLIYADQPLAKKARRR